MLMQRLAAGMKWPPAAGRCLLCKSGAIEDASHFLLACPVLAEQRARLLVVTQEAFLRAALPGAYLLGRFSRLLADRGTGALAMLLGARPHFPECPQDIDKDQWSAQCSKAAWLCDKFEKLYN